METIEPSLIFNRPFEHQDSLCLAWVFLCATLFFSVETVSAEVEPLYRHVDAVTRGTEVQVLQARRCRHRRHGSVGSTGT